MPIAGARQFPIIGDYVNLGLGEPSGVATAAAAAGVSERALMAQTGHRWLATLRKYIRVGALFPDNAAGHVGL